MQHRIRRIGVFQTSLVAAALFGGVGLLFAPIVWLMGRLPATEGAQSMGSFSLPVALAMPVMYAFMAFVATAIACGIYNVLAGITGGIEVEIEQVVR